MNTGEAGHWFSRCERATQEWLLANPGAALPLTAFDAVIGAGGTPVRIQTPDGARSEAYYLHPADSEYLTELRAAGLSGNGR
ncbi:hypothetical protein CLV46_0171 [Diaminobutyricimonas aerilata]|uniref:Uncharacterized protein n=1 Tax=Diaminobutyricimonas aerilata TaxID=1162967 RepID=A0A2M9CFI8_9MICO|nr:hypothetical protein [Diaminobutyricimonas aerilata]PJJ70649.1 hypothetical protein CLV46_0171 [Diaminobutyricimonas aerilata]